MAGEVRARARKAAITRFKQARCLKTAHRKVSGLFLFPIPRENEESSLQPLSGLLCPTGHDHKNIPCKNSSPEAGLFLSCKNICLSQIGSRAKNISCKTAIAAHMLTFLPSQSAHQDWHQAAFQGAISSGQHYGCSSDTDGDRLMSHAIIANEEDMVVGSRL